MKKWVWAVFLLVLLSGCRKERDPGPLPPQGPIADSPEWSLQKLVEALDSLEWKGDWVSAMLPSAFREGPAIAASLVYKWRERELILEFLAYERYESMRDLPADEACRRIALSVKEAFSKEPLRAVLARTLDALPRPPRSPETGHDAGGPETGHDAGGPASEDRSCLTIVQVSVQASPGDKPPYEEVSSCREAVPTGAPAANERTALSLPDRSEPP